jgi:hypothetical protein
VNPLDLLSWVTGAIDTSLSSVVNWATAAFGTLGNNIFGLKGVLDGLIDWLGKTLGSLWTWLNQLLTWLNDNILTKLVDYLRKLQDKLKKILKPITDMIDRYRRMLAEMWRLYVKPLYDFIQRLRRVLVLFRLLGFKWAKQLDARLVKMETAISDAFFAVWVNLNQLSNWINYILDPFGLFQPNVWLRSIQASIGAIIGIASDKMNDPGFTLSGPSSTVPDNYYDHDVLAQRCMARLKLGALQEDDDVILELRQSAADMGYVIEYPKSVT